MENRLSEYSFIFVRNISDKSVGNEILKEHPTSVTQDFALFTEFRSFSISLRHKNHCYNVYIYDDKQNCMELLRQKSLRFLKRESCHGLSPCQAPALSKYQFGFEVSISFVRSLFIKEMSLQCFSKYLQLLHYL